MVAGFIAKPSLLHCGGVGGSDGQPDHESSCLICLLISDISIPDHNLSIMLVLKITKMALVFNPYLNPII